MPVGYDLKDRQLVINESEAQTINWLYDTYLKVKCVRALKTGADRLGLTSKRYTQQSGKVVGGRLFSRGQLYCLLKNPLYIGKIRHRDKIYQGQHKAIVDQEVWDHVQTLLAANGGARKAARNVPSHGWLSRLLLDSTGEPMVVTHAKKQGRIYRYYVSASFMTKKSNMSQGWRLPAKEVESIVLSAIKTFLSDPVKVLKVLGAENLTAGIITRTTVATKNLTENIDTVSPADMKTKVLPIINQVRVNLYEVAIVFNINALGDALGIDVNDDDAPRHHTITLPVQLKRRGVEMRIVLPGLEQDNSKRDGAIRKLIARAHVWFDQLKSGTSITDIAKANAMDIADVSRVLPLAFLAPDIVTNILNGTQPIDLTAEKLKRCRTIPHAWNEQRRALGFA